MLWEGIVPSLSSSLNPTSSIPITGEGREVEILRTKAFIITENGQNWILQGVRDVYDYSEIPASTSSSSSKEEETEEEEIEPKLVLIGRGLKGDVRERLKNYLDEMKS